MLSPRIVFLCCGSKEAEQIASLFGNMAVDKISSCNCDIVLHKSLMECLCEKECMLVFRAPLLSMNTDESTAPMVP